MPCDGTAQRIGCARSPVRTNHHDAIDIAFGVAHVDGGVADQAVRIEGEDIRNAWHLDLVQWIQRHTPSIISWGMAVRP